MQTEPTAPICDELRAFVRTRFNVSEADPDFSDDTHLFDYGYVDSFGAVELTTFVEENFAVKVSQSDLIAFPMNTINQIAAFVADRRNNQTKPN